MLLEGYIEFENGIPITKGCLGQEYSIEVAGVAGFLVTPLMFEGFDGKEKLGPLREPKQGEIKFKDHFNWGSVYSWPEGYSSLQACKILFYDIDEQRFEETGVKISHELKKWRTLLIDNISLELEKDYRGPVRAQTFKSYGLGEFALFRKSKGGDIRFVPPDFKDPILIVEIGKKTLGFDKDELQQVLDVTSQGKTPLLPFYFLFDAERAKFEENYRKSILDSATAAEVCFSHLINHLLPYDESLNKYISSKHNSLKLKRELLKELKVSLPLKEHEYINSLDRVRNRVIHSGYNPTKDEANLGYQITKTTLYFLLPKQYEL